MSGELNHVSFVVLGIAANRGPTTSYDFKKYVQSSIGYFWPLSHMALYREPKRLADLGLLDARTEAGGRRRTFFTITASGRDALRTWLRDPDTQPPELRDEGLLKLHFSGLIPNAEVAELADAQIAIREQRLALYERLRERYGDLPDHEHQNQTLEAGFVFERAYIAFWRQIYDDALAAEVAPAKPVRTARPRARPERLEITEGRTRLSTG